MPNDHAPSTAYPPEIVEWIDTLSRPDPSNARYAARLARLLAILKAPDVISESAHFFTENLAGINAGTRQARIENFKNFIEEAAALPEKPRLTWHFNRIKHRFSEYRTPDQTLTTIALQDLAEKIEAINLLQYEYHAMHEKNGATEKGLHSPANTGSAYIEAWREMRTKRLAVRYLGLDNQPFATAILRVLFQRPGETPA